MTVTATLNVSVERVTIQLTGLPVLPTPGDPYPATPWTLFRTDGLTEQPVRAAIDRPLTASASAVLRDNEAPLNRPYLYALRYVSTSGPVTEYSAWVVPPARDLPRVSDPLSGFGVDATIVQWPSRTREARSSVIDVDGRTSPYVITGPMRAPQSQVVLRTLDVTSEATLQDLLSRGTAVQLRPAHVGVPDTYLLPSRYDLARLTNRASDPRRLHTVDVTEVSMPMPNVRASGSTLQDLADAYPGGTLADIAADYSTLFQIAAATL